VSPPSGVNPCQGGHSIGGPGGSGGSGGGISVQNGFLTLDSTQVADNHAGAGGAGGNGGNGGAGLAGSSCGKLGADLKDGGSAGFSEGGAGGAGGSGGGIALNGSAGAVNATDCTISGNVAGDGGAGGTAGAGGGGADAATGGAVADGGEGGAAAGGAGGGGGSGGGLEVFASGSQLPVNLTGCAITGNAAGDGGGGGAGAGGGSGGSANATTEALGGIGGAGDGGNGGGGGAGGGLALLQFATATIVDGTIADNATGAGADGGPADSGGPGGFGNGVESDGGEAVGGSGGSGGDGAAVADQTQSSASLSDDTIAGNGGGIGGNGGHGGVSANVAISSAGGNGGGAGGLAIAVSGASATLSHATVDANAVGAPGAGGPGGGLNTGNPNGPGAGGAPAAAGGLEGPLTLTASIVSGDPGGDCAASSGITDGGHNLTSPGSTCLLTVGDPKLGALADNGGPTQTQALGSGSAALGAIPAASGLCVGHDQRGVARPAGTPCDIGAYQVAAPAAVTGDVSGVSSTGATVAGSVTVNDPSATVHFDYGQSAAYGSATTTRTLGPGVTPTAVSAALTGLAPDTTYHYRIVATTRDGTSNGADATFKTSASGSAPGGGGGSFAGLKIAKQSVELTTKRVAPIKVSCPAATAGSCKGTLTVTIKVHSTKRVTVHHKLKLVHRTKTVKLCSIRFAVVAGHKATLKAKLSRAAVARVKRAGKLKTTATAKTTDSAGDAKTTHATVTLHRYVKPKHRKHGR